MRRKMKGPGALAGDTGAEMEAANFTAGQYRIAAQPATFTPIGTVALRVVHLVARHGMTPEQAAMLAPLAYGEGCP